MSEMSDLKARVDWLERRLAAVPVRFGKQADLPTILEVRGGNNIFTLGATNFPGILSSGSISSVPVATPIDGTIYANGLGYGYIIDLNGATLPALVWICNGTATNDQGTVFTSSVGFPIAKTLPVSSVFKINVTCLAGGTAPVYVVSRLG